MKYIIGVVGRLAAGKDTAAAILSEALRIPVVQISGILKEVAQERGIPRTRDALIDLGRQLSRERGAHCLAQMALERCPQRAIVAGMRQPEQIAFLRSNSRFTLLAIDAPAEARFERMRARAKHGDPLTLAEFERTEREDDVRGGQRTSECIALADHVVLNDRDEDAFAKQLLRLPLDGLRNGG